MNEILKQRLVGALILVALGVIFWPIIFVEPEDEGATLQSAIPARPGVATTPMPEPDPIGLRASPELAAREVPEPDVSPPPPAPAPEPPQPEPAAAPAPVPAAPAPREEPPAPLAVDKQGVPEAWILQVASVSSAQKADSLRMQLLDMGQKGYVRKIRRGDKDLYRVYVGPKFEKDRLERLRPDVDKAFGVKSMIVRYVP